MIFSKLISRKNLTENPEISTLFVSRYVPPKCWCTYLRVAVNLDGRYFPESFDFAKRTLPNCSTLFRKTAIFSYNYCVIMFELVGRELHCYITCFQVEAFV